jgi:ATP-dependent helicase/nuclease subunit B
MWHVQIKKEGGFGFRESSDVCDADEFLRVLDFVRGKLAGLADGILSGSIRIYPYRLHRKSPCAQCEFKSVCRFDVTLNGYNMLTEISRDELLKTVR